MAHASRFVIAGFLLTALLSAPSPVTAATSADGQVIANINVSSPAIIGKKGDTVTVSFDLANAGGTAQDDVRYGVEAIQIVDGRQYVADVFVADDTITLAPGHSEHREISYRTRITAPGNYEIWVIAKTSGGMLLGLGRAGAVDLAGSGAPIEIVTDSCKLSVDGSEEDFTIAQGIDLGSQETLTLDCLVRNIGSTTVSVEPAFEIRRRTAYGPVVDAPEIPMTPVPVSGGMERRIAVKVPQPTEPQAYDAAVEFRDVMTKKSVSNRVYVHYVLRGVSGTIRSATLDSSSYGKGDIIMTNVSWSGSADVFPASRGEGTALPSVTAALSITSSAGASCANPVTQAVPGDTPEFMITTVATTDCPSPVATITISDALGNVLDSRAIKSPRFSRIGAPKVAVSPEALAARSDIIKTILALLGGLFLVSLALIVWKRFDRRAGSLLGLISLILGGFGLGASPAHALTFDLSASNGYTYTFTVNTDKTAYGLGETINLAGTVAIAACGNPSVDQDVSLDASLQGTHVSLVNAETVESATYYGSGTLTAPGSEGAYSIDVEGCVSKSGKSGTDECVKTFITVDVVEIPVCGFAHASGKRWPMDEDPAGIVASQSTELCSVGIPQAMKYCNDLSCAVGTGWYWQCAQGTVTADCHGAVRSGATVQGACGDSHGRGRKAGDPPTDAYCSAGNATRTCGAGECHELCGEAEGSGSDLSALTQTQLQSDLVCPGGFAGTITNTTGTAYGPYEWVCGTTPCSTDPTFNHPGPGPWRWDCTGDGGGDVPCDAFVDDFIICPANPTLTVGDTTDMNAHFTSYVDESPTPLDCASCSATDPTCVTSATGWSVGNAAIASIDAAGHIIALAEGTTTITGSYTDSDGETHEATTSLSVNPAAPACTWDCSLTSDDFCAGRPFTITDSCGVTRTCVGTLYCDANWKEVAP